MHAPWGMALAARLRDSIGLDVQSIWSDDGIALHLPEADAPPSTADLLIGPDEIEELVVGEVGQTALFGARFRENAARALLIPRRRPGQRTPLWQQRLKAQNLLQVARKYGSFPIVLETYRECLQDVFDLPALKGILHGLQTRELDLVEVETASASPFASSLLFDYIATYMYEDDTPPAERRAQALSLDRDLLRELLGQEELRELIDPDALAEVERQLRGDPRDPDELHDVLRRRGDLRAGEYDEGQAAILLAERRALAVRFAGEERLIAAEDAGRYRDALGAMPPGGLPEAFLAGGADSLRQLVLRFAKGRGPFTTAEADERFGLALESLLHELERADLLVRGELRPGGSEREWCDPEVLRRLRRASLAALRREVEPAEQASFGRFLPAWHGIGRRASLREALVPLQGLALPVSLWESEVLPRRVPGYQPAWLDGLCAAGELVWVGAGLDRVAVYFREDAPLLGQPAGAPPPETPEAAAIREALGRSAMFWSDLLARDRARRRGGAARALGARLGRRGHERRLDAAARRPPLPGAARRSVGPRRFSRTRGASITSTQGRWSPTERLFAGVPDRRALAELLLERQGIVTRDGVRGEGIPGGYGAVYSELKDLETIGACRRGYFVEGLGGAQFALPGAVERLRELRAEEEPEPLVLAAADPAQPYGAALPWPKRAGARAARVAGAQVVLLGGEAALFVERGGQDARAAARARRGVAAAGRRGARRLRSGRRREAARGRALRRPSGHRDGDHAAARRGGLPRRSAPRRAAPVIHLNFGVAPPDHRAVTPTFAQRLGSRTRPALADARPRAARRRARRDRRSDPGDARLAARRRRGPATSRSSADRRPRRARRVLARRADRLLRYERLSMAVRQAVRRSRATLISPR